MGARLRLYKFQTLIRIYSPLRRLLTKLVRDSSFAGQYAELPAVVMDIIIRAMRLLRRSQNNP